MAFSADTLILIALALATTIVLGLFISIWQVISARRALKRARSMLAQHDQDLAEQTEVCEALQQRSHDKDIKLGSLESQLVSTTQRMQDRESEINRLRQTNEQISSQQSSTRDALAQSEAHAKGLDATLVQLQQQLEEKNREVSSIRMEFATSQSRLGDLQQEYAQLQTTQKERENQHQQQLELLNETRENLKKDFENLANKIFEDKGKSFTATSKESLESMLRPFREQITGFQARINEVHTESLKGNTALESEIKKVLEVGLEMNSQASNLTTALKGDKKTAGNWGEAQLERTLELAGLQPGEHYESQAAFRDGDGKRKYPDFIIKLPDSKSLIIDSKVSLVDYDRAIAADTEEECTNALAAHAQAVRNHIDDLAGKDYANLPDVGSPDFVLMFMPIEPAYIEAMKYNKDLFNYGYQKGVVMVSHTTLMPILRTVANLWMVEKSNREAKEISGKAAEIYNQVCLVAERLQKLGNTLSTANNHYNETVRGLVGKQGLAGKVDRFSQLSIRANKEMPALEELHQEIESERLEATTSAGEKDSGPVLVEPAAAAKPAKIEPLKTDKKK